MADYSTEHHKHHEKDSHTHSHQSSHGNRHDNHHDVQHDIHRDQHSENHNDSHHDNHNAHEDHDYYNNYGVDYGERARRILEASNHSSSTFKPLGHNQRECDTLQPGTNRSQTRRHSMFVDTSNVRLHHDSTPVHHVKQMHLDDIVLAYSKKHPGDRTIGHSDTSHHKHNNNETHNHSRTRSVEANERSEQIDHTKRETRYRNEHAHRSEQNHYREKSPKTLMNHKDDHSYDSCNTRLRDLHLSDSSRYHGKQGDHVGFEHRRASDIGARVGHRSPTAIEGHHISMTRANGYKHELTSPEIERFKAYRDRESNAKKMERHAIAQVITEACRRRHECEGHEHRRHSGHVVIHTDDMDTPVAGARRHTLASTTGKELQHRHRHSRKNREDDATMNERAGVNYEHARHLKYGERHHGSHDDVKPAHSRHHGDFLATPQITERRHSWNNISSNAH